ncbi:MAG: Uma2 family endonuclease [Gammaproteobacteria bacterium]|nr:Uma2 family endonuclease [Gammaproteobacteria bacterium]
MMQTRRRPAGSRTTGRPPAAQRSLAVVHAAALYRPTPPVECDEDGYPFSDAKPMSEGDYHGDVLDYAKGALRARFDGHEVYASTDKFLFLEEGNRRAAVVPDVLVAFGPPSGPRQSYKHWEEGKAPDFVLEVLSADNWRNDIERKPVLYAELGVREYWTFDPRRPHRWRSSVGGLASWWQRNPDADHAVPVRRVPKRRPRPRPLRLGAVAPVPRSRDRRDSTRPCGVGSDATAGNSLAHCGRVARRCRRVARRCRRIPSQYR